MKLNPLEENILKASKQGHLATPEARKAWSEKKGLNYNTVRKRYNDMEHYGLIKPELVLLAFRVTPELKERLVRKVKQEETSIQDYLTGLIEESL